MVLTYLRVCAPVIIYIKWKGQKLRFVNVMEFLGATQTAYKGHSGEHMWPPAMHSLHCFQYRDSLIILNHASLQVECYRQGFSEVNFTCVHGGYVEQTFYTSSKNALLLGGSPYATWWHYGACGIIASTRILMVCAISEGGSVEKFVTCKLQCTNVQTECGFGARTGHLSLRHLKPTNNSSRVVASHECCTFHGNLPCQEAHKLFQITCFSIKLSRTPISPRKEVDTTSITIKCLQKWSRKQCPSISGPVKTWYFMSLLHQK